MYSHSSTDESVTAPVAKETKSIATSSKAGQDIDTAAAAASPTHSSCDGSVATSVAKTNYDPTSAATPYYSSLDATTAASAMQPKKPLSAYNIFFVCSRKRLIGPEPKTGPYTHDEVFDLDLNQDNQTNKPKRKHRKAHGRISFTLLGKRVAEKWANLELDQRRLFDERAELEKKKYAVKIEAWLLSQVPTPHVKKRLAALRRGSLKKFLLQSSVKLPRASKRPPSASPRHGSTASNVTVDTQSARVKSPHFKKENSLPMPAKGTRCFQEDDFIPGSPQVSNSASGPQAQVERSAALQQLCDVQLQLYQDQVRQHQERVIFEQSSPIVPRPPTAVNYYQNYTVVAPSYGNYQVQHYFVPCLSTPSAAQAHLGNPPSVVHQGQQQDLFRLYYARQDEM